MACLRWHCLVACSLSPLCDDHSEMNVPKRYVILESNNLKYFIAKGGGVVEGAGRAVMSVKFCVHMLWVDHTVTTERFVSEFIGGWKT